MEREYYILWYRLDDKDSYLIYYEDEVDGLVVDDEGFVKSFSKIEDLINYSKQIGIKVDIENPNFLNLDVVQNWLDENSFIEISDYNPYLEAWNLFADISNSVNSNFDKEKDLTNKIYNKIFWGCNIPAVTPEGKAFTPSWTKKELKIMQNTLKHGFQMFRKKVKAV